MKSFCKPLCNKLLLFFFTLLSFSSRAQVSPTLGVGLEQLTMNKGTIDVQVLTEIIMEKQKELKEEALKRYLFRLFPDNSYTTKHYLQSAIHILLNEKNPHVIEKELLELTTNYAVALGVANAYKREILPDGYVFKSSNKEINILLKDVNDRIVSNIKDIYPNGLDFNLLVDVVALSLSESAEIKKKGFYKNKINYTEGNLYRRLVGSDVVLHDLFQNLKVAITKEVDTYVVNFEIIKEYFEKYKDTKEVNIIEKLEKDYVRQINTIATEGAISMASIIKEMELDASTSMAFKNYFNANNDLAQAKKHNDLVRNTLFEIENAITGLKIAPKNEEEYNKALSSIQSKGLLKSSVDLNTLKMDTITSAEVIANINVLKEISNQIQQNTQRITNIKQNFIKISEWKATPTTFIKQEIPLENIQQLESLKANINAQTISEEQVQKLEDSQKEMADKVFSDITFLEKFIKEQLNLISGATATNYALSDITNETQLKIIKEYSQNLTSFYLQLQQLSQKNIITIADIKNIEDNIIPKLMQISFLKTSGTSTLNKIKTNFNILSNILKLNQINKFKNNDGSNLTFNTKILDILTFLSNLDQLDKANTYQSIINLIRDLNDEVIASFDNIDDQSRTNFNTDKEKGVKTDKISKDQEKEKLEIDEAKKIYLLFVNAIKKYTLINTEQEYINIDVVSFLNDLQQYYSRNEKSWFSLYFTLGLNQNFLFNERVVKAGENPITSVGFASEKLGVKIRFWSLKSTKTTNKALRNDLYLSKKNPFVNEFYGILYGSGLLYSLANTATNENFDYPHLGFGVGWRFYNALDVNFVIGLPFIDGEPFATRNGFFGIGLDIPLSEYLEKIGKK